ncbi:hypothetical protein D3C81_1740780 [compost metagenome]
MTIHRAATQAVADQAHRTKPHQVPANPRAIESGQTFKDIGQVGIDGEHTAEHQH